MTDETTTTTETATSTTENPSIENPTPNPASSNTDGDGIDLAKTGDEPKDEGGDKDGDAPKDEGGDKDGDEPNPLFGAPEEGTAYELTGLPEGVTVDAEALEAAAPVFRELGLSNEGASKVAGIYAEKVLPLVEKQFQSGLEQQIVDQRTAWQGETIAAIKGETELKTKTGDKIDFGGSSLKQVQQSAAAALDRIAPEGFREFLDETGLGQHPAMVAFAYRVGQLIAEDKDFETSSAPTAKPTLTQKFYNR